MLADVEAARFELVLPGGTLRSLLMSDLGVDDGLHELRAQLTTARSDARGQRVALWPDEWRQLENWCHRHSVHGLGGHYTEEAATRAFATLAMKISRAIARFSAHPAYRGLGAMGTHREALPAWKLGPVLAPTIDMLLRHATEEVVLEEAQFGILWPQRLVRRGRAITRWTWQELVDES